jgi:hypothetical protein
VNVAGNAIALGTTNYVPFKKVKCRDATDLTTQIRLEPDFNLHI